MSFTSAACRTPLVRVAPEVGSLRFKYFRFLPTVYRPPPMPVTEIVVDMAETKKQFYREKRSQKPKVIKHTAINVYVENNLKLLPETAAPFLTEKIKQGYAVKGCCLCLRNLQEFGSKDVLLLRQFMTPWGEALPRSQTGVCKRVHRRLSEAIIEAQQNDLLPRRENPKRDEYVKKRYDRRNHRASLQLKALRDCGGLKEEEVNKLASLKQQVIQ